MRILITGINGLLGQELIKHFPEDFIAGITTKEVTLQPLNYFLIKSDITTKDIINDIITIKPDVVIHCAVLSDVDKCEEYRNLAFKVNALGTRNVALACQELDIPMVYISTDYVFGKEKKLQGYMEFEQPCPVNIYGESKLLGEEYVKMLLKKFIIIRTSWLFGHARKNLIDNIIFCYNNLVSFRSATDMVSSPTNVKDLSEAIKTLITNKLYGIYHITNNGYVSRFSLAHYVGEIIKGNVILNNPDHLYNLGLRAPRPNFSGLNNYVWRTDGLKEMRTWEEAVSEYIKEKGIIY